MSLEEERRENSGEKIEKFYIDFFLSKNMILSFEKILQCETNAIVIVNLLFSYKNIERTAQLFGLLFLL